MTEDEIADDSSNVCICDDGFCDAFNAYLKQQAQERADRKQPKVTTPRDTEMKEGAA